MIGADPAESARLVAEWRDVTGWAEAVHGNDRGLEKILASACAPAFPGAILPWPRKQKQTVYYGVARSQAEWRRLRPLLVAWAGPTVTGFSGAPQAPNARWGAESFLAEHAFAAVARLVPADEPPVRAFVQKALERLCSAVVDNRAAGRRPIEPTSKLLGRLDGALADQDRKSAESILKRLHDEDRLDGVNLTFLAIQIAAAFRDWPAVTGLPEFDDIVASRRPAAVTTAVLDALYAVRVAPADENGDVQNALAPLAPMLRELLSEPRPPLGPGGARLAALIDGRSIPMPPAAESADAIVSPTTKADVAVARLVDAMRSDSLEVLRAALEAVDALDSAERDELLDAPWIAEMWREAGARTECIAPPRNWADWLSAIASPGWQNSLDVARTAAGQWTVEEQLGDPVVTAELANKFLTVPEGIASARLVEAVPVLVRWLHGDPEFPRASLSPVYDALWTLLVLGVRRGQAELESGAALFDALLTCGLTAARYRELLADALDLAADPGRRSAYWLLGLVESTIAQPAPDGAARENFWATALSRVAHLRAQLSRLQLEALRRLALTLGVPGVSISDVAATDTATVERQLDGRRIAVYSLTESAGKQAADVLSAIAPSTTVTLHSDHVGSQPLKSAAENADLFVIVTSSAKHAATDFIRRHRGDRPLVFAAGRGATSILRAIDEHFAQ